MNQGRVTDIDTKTGLKTTIAIIGGGFAGLGMAIQLSSRGHDDYLILEKEHDVGGTWRDNTYPGCGCDVPTALYSYSFEQNPYWSKLRSPQPEIWAYLQHAVDKHNLRSKVLLGSEVVEYKWDRPNSSWRLLTGHGRTIVARYVVMAIGPYPGPNIPKFKGADSFTGPSFHSAQWDHSVDLVGKRVAVIGTGASAIQFVPVISERVGQLQLYQRSPPWVVGRRNSTVHRAVQTVFAKLPLSRNLFRAFVYLSAEFQGFLTFGLGGRFHWVLESLCKLNIRRSIKDSALRAKLIPRYQLGCKRLLYSSTYYPALARSNAEVITEAIAEIRPRSIVTIDGRERDVDVIIYATGFQVIDKILALNFLDGEREPMTRQWRAEGLQAYKGVAHAGLPNLFVLVGPNSAVIYTSLVFIIEQQIKYVLQILDNVRTRRAAVVEVRKEAQDRFNAIIHRKLATRVWSTGGCTNFYLDPEGVNRLVWPGFSWQYWWTMRNVNDADFKFSGVDTTAGSLPRRRSRRGRSRGSTSFLRPLSSALASLASRFYC